MGRIEKFSEKQLTAVSWWHPHSPHCGRDAIICDGAVRSGKTFCLSVGFVSWATACFDRQSFALCGRTVVSLRRNLIAPLLPCLGELGLRWKDRRAQGYLEVSRGKRVNRFYLFGGKDEGSAALIQGVTLAGVLLDEVALMPRSFVEQAAARCSVEGARLWFSCNPEHPAHWFLNEWIKKAEEKNALYLHFEMRDNPALSPAVLARYQKLYSGSFYERFVLGRWVAAQGVVYPMFDPQKHLVEHPPACSRFYISCDYGTVNPASMGLWGERDGVWYRLEEFYYDSRREGRQMTDEEYYRALERLAGERKIEAVVIDPSAASFIACIRGHGRFRVLPAKNAVADGIRLVGSLLQQGKLRFSSRCADLIREFSLYRWEARGGRDCPVKENDHAMDDMRYFAATVIGAPEGGGFFAACSRGNRQTL